MCISSCVLLNQNSQFSVLRSCEERGWERLSLAFFFLACNFQVIVRHFNVLETETPRNVNKCRHQRGSCQRRKVLKINDKPQITEG